MRRHGNTRAAERHVGGAAAAAEAAAEEEAEEEALVGSKTAVQLRRRPQSVGNARRSEDGGGRTIDWRESEKTRTNEGQSQTGSIARARWVIC